MRATSASSLAPLLARRRGVLLREEVARACDPRVAEREVAAGRWSRPLPGVFVAAPVPDEQQLWSAALLHTWPCTALTGRAACLLHGLRDVPSGLPVQVLVPHGVRRCSTPLVQVLRTRHWQEPVRVRGLPVVGAVRAVHDAALAAASLREVRALVLGAVSGGRVVRGDLAGLVALTRRPGSGELQRALRDAARGVASAPEAEAADALVPWASERGLEVLFNPVLVVDGVGLCSPDAYLPGVGVGLETESVRHHGTGRDLAATLQRHRRVERAGVRLLHETPWSVRHELPAVLARLAAEVRDAPGAPPDVRVLVHDDALVRTVPWPRGVRAVVPGAREPTDWDPLVGE